MSITVLLNIIVRSIDLIMGLIGLLLIVRVILHLFNVPYSHPAMRVVIVPTEPLLKWLNNRLDLRSYTYRLSATIDINLISSLVLLVLLWGLHMVVTWVFNIAGAVVLAFSGGPGGWLHLLSLLLQILFGAYQLAIILRVIFDWLHLPQSNGIVRFLYTITEPLLAQIRKLMPIIAGFDFSPVIAIFLLQLLHSIAQSIVRWIF